MTPAKVGTLVSQIGALFAAASTALAGTQSDGGAARMTPPIPAVAPIAGSPRWSVPDGAPLRLLVLSDAQALNDPVAARVEQAPPALELPRNSVIEGRVVFVDDASQYRGGSLTVLFERILPGGRGPSQEMEPFAVQFKHGHGTARLNKLLLVGAPAAAAALGALAAGGTGAYSFAPGGLGYAFGFARHPGAPALKAGARRRAMARKIDPGINTAAMRRTARWPLLTLPDLRARAETEPAACALYRELRAREPSLLARLAEHYASRGEERVANEVLAEATAMCGRSSTLAKYAQGADNMRAKALADIAVAHARLGDISKARAIADTIKRDFHDSIGGLAVDATQAAVATRLARTGNFRAALELANDDWGCRWVRTGRVAECLSDESSRRRTLTEIAIQLAGAGQIDRAFRTIDTIDDGAEKGRALEALSLSLLARGQGDRGRRALADAARQSDDAALLVGVAAAYRGLGASDEGQRPLERAVLLTDTGADDHNAAALRVQVARECFAYGRQRQAEQMLDHAFEIVKAAKYEAVRQQLALLRDMTAVSAHAGRYERAIEMAKAIEDEDYGDEALAEVVRALAQADKVDQAFALTGTITSPDHRATALCAVGGKYASAGNETLAVAALTMALAAVPESLNPTLHLIEIDTQYRAAGLAPDETARDALRVILASTQQ